MVPPPQHFVACPSCGCHAKPHEVECPHCGARLRRADGSLPRTAAALLLGLSAVSLPMTIGSGCGSDVESQGQGGSGAAGPGSTADVSSATHYGVSSTVGDGSGGMAGMGGMGGMASSTSSAAPAYGVPQTDDDMDGFIDAQRGGDDCDDMNPDIHPGAPEKPGDGVDSNCDGSDDT